MAVATTLGPRLSRRVEARASRLFEARVFARNFGRSAEKIRARSGQAQQEGQSHLPTDRYVRTTRLLSAWDDDSKIRPYIGIR
jgi:hypothetical protein